MIAQHKDLKINSQVNLKIFKVEKLDARLIVITVQPINFNLHFEMIQKAH